MFEVEGIPSLVILSPDGTIVTKAGDDAVRPASSPPASPVFLSRSYCPVRTLT